MLDQKLTEFRMEKWEEVAMEIVKGEWTGFL